MGGAEVLDIGRDAIWTLIVVASPMMLAGLVVGVVVALIQALTQIQEQTLVFVPKILAIFITMLVTLPFLGATMNGLMTRIAGLIHLGRLAMTVGLNWLPQTAFLFILIFARVGTILMLIPALGEQAIPAQLRLTFALAFSLVLLPLLSASLPPLPTALGPIGIVLLHEIAVGLILGGITRFIVLATDVAGAIIAFQTGLSMAQGADPSQSGIQGVIIGNFLNMLGITLIFATDLHHLALSAIVESYKMIAPTDPLMLADAAQMALRVLSEGFVVGVQMAAPFIVFGLVFNIGMGILSRLMPALQVYFLAMPANIGVGLLLFAILLSTMMGWYLTHVQSQFAFIGGG